MPTIRVNERRIGNTRCPVCCEHITLSELVTEQAHVWGRIEADSANGYEVVHGSCATRSRLMSELEAAF